MSRTTRSRIRDAFLGSQGSSPALIDSTGQEQERQGTAFVPSSQVASRPRLRVTRSQAQSTPTVDLTQVIEEIAGNITAQAEEDDDDDDDGNAEDIMPGRFAGRRNLALRKSLVAGYGDDEQPERSRISRFAPLSVEERATRLYRDSGVVLHAVLQKGDEDSQEFQMTMMAKWKNWEAARGSIFDNERFVYFLDERVLRTIDGFNPFDHSVTLESAIRLANIAGFVRIIDEPTDAAESLESAGKTENASDALKAAWIDFLRYCVPKPWGGDRSAISLLVDLAVQTALFALQETGEPLNAGNRIHDVVQAALDSKSLERLEGWSTNDSVLDERLICSNIYEETARAQLNRLRQYKTTESAIKALPYQEFRQEMLSFIAEAYNRLDLEPRTELEETGELQNMRKMQEVPETQEVQGTQMILEGQELDEEEAEEEEQTQLAAAQYLTAGAELPEVGSTVPQNDVVSDDEEEVDSELNLDDLAAYEQTLAPVLTGPAQDSSAEPAWELRTNAAPMTMAETLRGRVLNLQDTDQRRFQYGDSEAVSWDSQEPESSRQAQIRQQTKGRKRATSPPVPPTVDIAQEEEDMITVIQRTSGPPAPKRSRLHRATSQTVAAVPSGSNAPATRRRDHRAGHYTHQPDIDLAGQGGGVDTPTSDAEVEPEAPPAQPRVAARSYRFDPADEYLYDDKGRPLHDRHGAPLQLYEKYDSLSHLTKDQANKAPTPDGRNYRSIRYTRWTREDALFLYREVQKVPICLIGQPTAYVYRRFRGRAVFEGRNSNQVRDKMKDLVKQRVVNKQLVLGAARHYLPSIHASYADYRRERDEASRGLYIHKSKTPARADTDEAGSYQSNRDEAEEEADEAGMEEAGEEDNPEEAEGELENSEEEEEEEVAGP